MLFSTTNNEYVTVRSERNERRSSPEKIIIKLIDTSAKALV